MTKSQSGLESSPAETPDAEQIHRAAERLAQGGLVALPTETVYGLGADACNPVALARIYAVKGRPSNHPVIVHLAPDGDIAYWVSSLPAEAQRLIDTFWPGPLTLILPRAAHIPAAVSGGQSSIGLRCPSHPVAQSLLREFSALMPGGRGGVAAPSANKFGRVSPTTADHVRAEFPELDESQLLILPGGASQVGIESTIVDLSRLDNGGAPYLLRPGHISARELEEVLQRPVLAPDSDAPRVSGSLKAHYAPGTPVELLSRQALESRLSASAHGRQVAVVLSGIGRTAAGYDVVLAGADADAYARNLYALMRDLDAAGYSRILLELPPDTPEWAAVRDRIGRAAAAFEE
ncbi:L-threonylcarbamoyladenylate synthase [Paracandidimonas soli]|uniref:L-threonylcarbamoyladenylate synthase n=1 Tax=Paracandidimonas soli TaxID=1917182 RepID=UPI0033422BE2